MSRVGNEAQARARERQRLGAQALRARWRRARSGILRLGGRPGARRVGCEPGPAAEPVYGRERRAAGPLASGLRPPRGAGGEMVHDEAKA